MSLYEIKGLTFAYPDIISERDDIYLDPCLNDINITIEQGEFVVVAGGSGSGKTTLLRQLKPVLTPRGKREGAITFAGQELSQMDEKMQTQKIGFVMQDVDAQLVTDKVWHELAFGLESLRLPTETIRKRVAEMCSFFGLNSIFHKKVNELSGGQKQLVNLASVLALSPDVVILDEPASQLDPMAARDFFRCLERINKELGITIIITEHRLEELWAMCDRFILLDHGMVLYDGTIQEGVHTLYETEPSIELPAACRIALGLQEKEQVPVTVTDGRNWLIRYDREHEQIDEVTTRAYKGEHKIIEIKDVFFRYDRMACDVLHGLNLSVYEGEILAINGSNGCGKSTLLSLIAGAGIPYRGRIRIGKGKKVGLLPQDPKLLFTASTVRGELGIEKNSNGAVAQDKTGQSSRYRITELCGLTKLLERHPYDLSGGEQQRLGLARVLIGMPDVILMDEPTKGMDAEFKQTFAEILRKLQMQGCTIVIVSHDIEFCAQTADQVCLIFDGETAVVNGVTEYFTGNEFYTTAAARIARGIVDHAVTVKDVLAVYGKNTDRSGTDAGASRKNADKTLTDIEDSEQTEKNTGKHKQSGVKSGQIGDKQHKSIVSGKAAFVHRLGLMITTLVMAACFIITIRQSDLTRLIDDGRVTSEGIMYIGIYVIFILTIGLFLCLLRPLAKAQDREIERKKRYHISRKNMIVTIACILAAAATIWMGKAVLSDRKYYFISLLVLIEMMIPFGVAFETRKVSARDLVTVAVLCALAAVGRTAFFMIPNFNPVIAIVIISGVAFGCETGFITGAVTMLVSNMVFGQGPWTPWQMFSMGLVGFAAGLVFNNSKIRGEQLTRLSLCVFGGFCCIIIYGGIMNPASVIMWQPTVNLQMIIAAYVTGFPFDVVQGFATVLFLWLMACPFLEKLDRIKIKYGVLCEVKEHA